jgi:hypothetical protein
MRRVTTRSRILDKIAARGESANAMLRREQVPAAIAGALVILSCCGCFYPKPVVFPDDGSPRVAALDAERVILLEPEVMFENENGGPSDPDEQAETVEKIRKAITSAATSAGFRVGRESALSHPNEAERARGILRSSRSLFEPKRRLTALVEQLKVLGNKDVVVFAAIKTNERTSVGTGTGGPTAVLRRTSNIVVAVIDLRVGRVVWIKEVFFRSRPPGLKSWSGGIIWADAPYFDILEDSLKTLLSDFPRKAG